MDAEHVQHRLDLIAAALVVLLLLYLLFGGVHFGGSHRKASPPSPTPTSAAPSSQPGGTCPAGKVPVTIGDETGKIGGNTTPDEIAETVSRRLQFTVSADDISAKNPGLIRNGRTTAGFNGLQCLNY